MWIARSGGLLLLLLMGLSAVLLPLFFVEDLEVNCCRRLRAVERFDLLLLFEFILRKAVCVCSVMGMLSTRARGRMNPRSE